MLARRRRREEEDREPLSKYGLAALQPHCRTGLYTLLFAYPLSSSIPKLIPVRSTPLTALLLSGLAAAPGLSSMASNTIMGPSSMTVKELSPADPSFFNPNGDFQEYRCDVSRCIDMVSAAAETRSDRMYQTVLVTLARQLYSRGLLAEQKSSG